MNIKDINNPMNNPQITYKYFIVKPGNHHAIKTYKIIENNQEITLNILVLPHKYNNKLIEYPLINKDRPNAVQTASHYAIDLHNHQVITLLMEEEVDPTKINGLYEVKQENEINHSIPNEECCIEEGIRDSRAKEYDTVPFQLLVDFKMKGIMLLGSKDKHQRTGQYLRSKSVIKNTPSNKMYKRMCYYSKRQTIDRVVIDADNGISKINDLSVLNTKICSIIGTSNPSKPSDSASILIFFKEMPMDKVKISTLVQYLNIYSGGDILNIGYQHKNPYLYNVQYNSNVNIATYDELLYKLIELTGISLNNIGNIYNNMVKHEFDLKLANKINSTIKDDHYYNCLAAYYYRSSRNEEYLQNEDVIKALNARKTKVDSILYPSQNNAENGVKIDKSFIYNATIKSLIRYYGFSENEAKERYAIIQELRRKGGKRSKANGMKERSDIGGKHKQISTPNHNKTRIGNKYVIYYANNEDIMTKEELMQIYNIKDKAHFNRKIKSLGWEKYKPSNTNNIALAA